MGLEEALPSGILLTSVEKLAGYRGRCSRQRRDRPGPRIVVADRGPGGLDQDRLEMLVAVAAPAVAAFAGGLVVARADPGPGGQAGGVGEELRGAGARSRR